MGGARNFWTVLYILNTVCSLAFSDPPRQEEWPKEIRSAVEVARSSGFYLTILHREFRGKAQYVAILGEVHTQGPSDAEKGRQIVSLFAKNGVGYEGQDLSRYWSTFLFRPLLSGAEDLQPHSTMLQVSGGRIPVSRPIALEEGHTPDLREELGYGGIAGGVLLLTGIFTRTAAGNPCVQAFANLEAGQQAKEARRRIVARLAYGQMAAGAALMLANVLSLLLEDQYPTAPQSTSGVVGNRNVTMSGNVQTHMGREDGSDIMLLTVGMAHNDGIAFHLQRAGFSTIHSQFGDRVSEDTRRILERAR